jgi:hypothetical protein
MQLSASAYNAPSYFLVPECFQRLARGHPYDFPDSRARNCRCCDPLLRHFPLPFPGVTEV